jgi:HD-like signal output (HDOD) protein
MLKECCILQSPFRAGHWCAAGKKPNQAIARDFVVKTILIASTDLAETQSMMQAISDKYSVSATKSASGIVEFIQKSSLLAIDHSYVQSFGKDYLLGLIRQSQRPVLVLVPPDGIQDAIDALKAGASNYLIKMNGYHGTLGLFIDAAIERFNEQEKAKEIIVALQKRVKELERGMPDGAEAGAPAAQTGSEANILDEIVYIFKRGEINLPTPPQISVKFKEMVGNGANIQDIAYLLKQDVAISSKLISISNSAFYRGVAENKTLDQAVGRLGLTTTKRYVDVITNRALYFTKNKKFAELIEKLWEHSLSCAYASQIVAEMLKLKLPEDAFTLGLLHDIGKLVLFQAVGELQLKKKIGESIDTEELFKTVDTNHGRFGGALLKRWKFSDEYFQVASYHNFLEEADSISKELLVVHFANLLVKAMGYALRGADEVDVANAESARLLKMNAEMIDHVKERVKTHMEELKGYFA